MTILMVKCDKQFHMQKDIGKSDEMWRMVLFLSCWKGGG